MKKLLAIILLALLYVVAPDSAMASQSEKQMDELEKIICAGPSLEFIDRIITVMEFEGRISHMMSDDIDTTLEEELQEFRDMMRAELESIPFQLESCRFADVQYQACDSYVEQIATVLADIYSGEETSLDSVKKFVEKTFADMGVSECAAITVDVTLIEDDELNSQVDSIIAGLTPKGWVFLTEPDNGIDGPPPIHDDPPMDGGACAYTMIPGNIEITEVREADPDAYNCDDNPVEIIFTFTPTTLADRESYIFPEWEDSDQHITIGSGMNPSRIWAEDQGLVVGASLPAERREITMGACTPVLFEFPSVDFSTAFESCYYDY